MGVHNTYLRQKILLCTEEVAQMEARLAKKLADIEGGGDRPFAAANAVPSAPPASLDPGAASAPPMEREPEGKGKEAEAEAATPSAPPSSAAAAAAPVVETFKSTECVVCMENKVRW